jgi:hypothetical protein
MTNLQAVKWCNDLGMGLTFAVTFVTGLFKWTLLMRMTGLYTLVLPTAHMSEIHDWAGLLLGIFVTIHLYLNRAWIATMTRDMLGSRSDEHP